MKRLISFILALTMLCTPACAFSPEDIPELPKEIFENQELKDATQELIGDLQSVKEAIKAMSDAELEALIRQKAAEYHIPDMNQEQIDFLMDLARSLETMENFGNTVKDYQEKAESIGDTLDKLLTTLNGLLEKLTGLLDSLQSIVGLMDNA